MPRSNRGKAAVSKSRINLKKHERTALNRQDRRIAKKEVTDHAESTPR
jgi:hypothetical protein